MGYRDERDIGDFITDGWTDLENNKLIEYYKRKYPQYKIIRVYEDTGQKPDFIGAIK